MVKLNFKIAPIDYDVRQLHRFLNPDEEDWDWSEYVKRYYPNLNKKDSKEEIKKFLIKFRKKKKKELGEKKEEYKRGFEKISSKIILEFKNILELNEIRINKIDILISLNPINPYDLEEKKFSVYWNFPIEDMIAISIHEIFHFLYFEKWMEIFPKTDYHDLDPPNLIWHLSELVVSIVLNDKKIQNVFEYPHKSYDEYDKLKINGGKIIQIFSELYYKRKNFSSFMKESYDFVLKHEKEIQEI